MNKFTTKRILGLIEFPWDEIPFSKYLVENPNKFKLIQVEAFNNFGCSDEEKNKESWIKAKNSSDIILKIVESIYSVTEDLTMAKYVSENWDSYFSKKSVSKRKNFEKFFSDIINTNDLRTISVLKACSRDCINIAMHHLDEQFSNLSPLKHPSKHNVIIKTAKNIKEKLSVIHLMESSSKFFNLIWQLVIDFEWIDGSPKRDVNLFISKVTWKKNSFIGSDLDEAVSSCILKYTFNYYQQKLDDEIYKKKIDVSNYKQKEEEEEEEKQLLNDNNEEIKHDSLSNKDIKQRLSSKTNRESNDLSSISSDNTDSEFIIDDDIDDFNFVQSSIIAKSSSQFISRSVSYYKENMFSIQCSNPSLLICNTPRFAGGYASISMDNENLESKYSTPLLLPGEVIQTSIPNIKHEYDIPVSQTKNDISGDKKSSKWFGVSRLATSTKKSKSKIQAVKGNILLTTFQLIFVPAIVKSLSSETNKNLLAPSSNIAMSNNTTTRLTKKSKGHRRIYSAYESPSISDDNASFYKETKQCNFINEKPLEEMKKNEQIVSPNGLKDLDEHIYVPYQMIFKIEKIGKKHLSLYCKDFRTIHFSFKDSEHTISNLIESFKIYLPQVPLDSFAPRFCASYKHLINNDTYVNGWKIFDAKYELDRILRSDPAWRITSLNIDYKLCDSYPKLIAIPSKITDDELLSIKEFRSRGRLPSLSWRHPSNGASLTRCSQPRVGLSRTRCKEDEKLLYEIMVSNQSAINSNCEYLYILDARPKANAMANQAVGAGYETSNRYKQTKVKFLQIPNIHVMRDSVRKLHELSQPYINSTGFLTQLESSKWLEYIQLILRSSLQIAKILTSGSNVLIHCSDGWDRTSQLSAIAMLLLDPYYRTLKGFICLIEKEWLSGGHKFADRCGHNTQVTSESETSPVFNQFIDCVWQLLQQFPCEFEFNEHLLITILDQAHISQFGTFLYNCERERLENELHIRTESIWTFIYDYKQRFCSPYYVGYQDSNFFEVIEHECMFSFLRPNTSLKSMRLWTNYYLRYDRTVPKGNLFREAEIYTWECIKNNNSCKHKPEIIPTLQRQLEEEKRKNALLQEELQKLKNKQYRHASS